MCALRLVCSARTDGLTNVLEDALHIIAPATVDRLSGEIHQECRQRQILEADIVSSFLKVAGLFQHAAATTLWKDTAKRFGFLGKKAAVNAVQAAIGATKVRFFFQETSRSIGNSRFGEKVKFAFDHFLNGFVLGVIRVGKARVVVLGRRASYLHGGSFQQSSRDTPEEAGRDEDSGFHVDHFAAQTVSQEKMLEETASEDFMMKFAAFLNLHVRGGDEAFFRLGIRMFGS